MKLLAPPTAPAHGPRAGRTTGIQAGEHEGHTPHGQRESGHTHQDRDQSMTDGHPADHHGEAEQDQRHPGADVAGGGSSQLPLALCDGARQRRIVLVKLFLKVTKDLLLAL